MKPDKRPQLENTKQNIKQNTNRKFIVRSLQDIASVVRRKPCFYQQNQVPLEFPLQGLGLKFSFQ